MLFRSLHPVKHSLPLPPEKQSKSKVQSAFLSCKIHHPPLSQSPCPPLPLPPEKSSKSKVQSAFLSCKIHHPPFPRSPRPPLPLPPEKQSKSKVQSAFLLCNIHHPPLLRSPRPPLSLLKKKHPPEKTKVRSNQLSCKQKGHIPASSANLQVLCQGASYLPSCNPHIPLCFPSLLKKSNSKEQSTLLQKGRIPANSVNATPTLPSASPPFCARGHSATVVEKKKHLPPLP